MAKARKKQPFDVEVFLNTVDGGRSASSYPKNQADAVFYIQQDKAAVVALIVNELVTNAVKHGFRDGAAGTVAVSMRQTDGNSVTLSVTDDGAPLPLNSKSNSVGIGLTLVSRLADQLGGALTVTATPKRFVVVFSALAAEQR